MTQHPSEETLNAWANDRLSEEKAKEVENHFKSCVMCKEAVGEIQWLVRVFNALPSIPLERQLTRQTLLALKKEKNKSVKSWSNFLQDKIFELSRPLMLATVTIGLILGFVLGNVARLMFVPTDDDGTRYAMTLPGEESQSPDPYIDLLLTDNGSDL